MNIRRSLFCLLSVGLSAAYPANADTMYRCVDADGRKVLSNVKLSNAGTKCTEMRFSGPAPTVSSGKGSARTPTPASFPRVDGDAQRTRDNERRRILEGELETEQRNLDQAKKDLEEQESIRSGNEKNYQRVLDRLQPYKDKVASHERNLEAIQKEISNLR